jgi:GntR family transcriptional regulator / MocR family aminotransferase
VTGHEAGGHVVVWPRDPISEASIIKRAAARGVRVYGISGYCLRKSPRSGIILRYSRMNEKEIREGIRRLSEAVSTTSIRTA